MRSPRAVPIPTRRASEGTGCASATVLGQRASLARRVSVAPGRIAALRLCEGICDAERRRRHSQTQRGNEVSRRIERQIGLSTR